MKAVNFIADRISFKERMASVAIALSFLVIIVAVAITAGFRSEICGSVSELAGDFILSGPEPVPASPSYLQDILEVDGVSEVRPAIYKPGIIRKDGEIAGVMVKGVETADSSLTARIPSGLAASLGLERGSSMLTWFVGDKARARRFTVGCIYDSVIDAGDSPVVYVPISDLQRLNGWSPDEVSVLEVRMDRWPGSRRKVREKALELGSICFMSAIDKSEELTAEAVSDRYPGLFDWLDLLDFNVVAILLLMAVVAGFNMISGLLILLFRNISTIGTLKSLGMDDRGIAGVFLKVGARTAFKGMLAGNAIALLFCLIQGSTRLIRLNPANYFVSCVPVKVNVPAILAADAATFVTIMALLLLTTSFISKVDPSVTVRTQ